MSQKHVLTSWVSPGFESTSGRQSKASKEGNEDGIESSMVSAVMALAFFQPRVHQERRRKVVKWVGNSLNQ